MKKGKTTTQKQMGKIFRGLAEVRILWELRNNKMHGYKLFESIVPANHKMQPSRIYPFLKSLERRNLIKSKVKYVGKRKRKEYTLTPKGRKYLKDFKKRIPSSVRSFLRYLVR
ncbi:PadR family transcriptional regulator [Candidatus Micrarchaeota archaeon]|nr:PadR family transcriptional regulator [Candidatus Micrarchaeota archaeon]